MDTKQYADEWAAESRLLAGMAFLAENPEAYGLVPDACPAVTSDLLLAVNGHGATGGELSPTYPVEEGGVDGLLDNLYGNLIPRTDENTRLLRTTFGESEGMQEHPVARYCAALAEVTALRILDGTAKGASPEQACFMLNEEIPHHLARLRETICGDGVTPRDDAFFSVSLGACRVTSKGEGSYLLDIFAAGDFRVYLLDGEGLHPLWLRSTPRLLPAVAREFLPDGAHDSMPHGTDVVADEASRGVSEGVSNGTESIMCNRLELYHPDPFALLLLSDSLCALGTSEARVLRENPGMVWRYRMRLEDQFLRLITACVREQEFGERATRFFTGRSHGRDSASGAMMILREGVSYEVFRTMCQTRLSQLEALISLMPEGYDPARIPTRISREEMEENHLRRMLERERGIADRVAEAVRLCALEKLKRGDVGEVCPPPTDAPAYRRLSWQEIHTVYRRYDAENDTDRARVAENRHVLRENLANHWIALRPYLLQISSCTPTPAAERCYAACADMSARLGRMLAERKKRLRGLESLLSDSLSILRADGRDWMEGRAGDGSIAAWSEKLTRDLPDSLQPVLETWQADTEAYRSLLTAYTYERELLFRMDTKDVEGFFASDWLAMQDGDLADSRWNAIRDLLEVVPTYRDLWDSLCRVSKGTGALLARIHGRGAERRMARELAGRSDIQLAALRASAYEDEDWGESVVAVMEPPLRREHKDAVRRWQETRELVARRAEAYAAYSTAWSAYLPEETAEK